MRAAPDSGADGDRSPLPDQIGPYRVLRRLGAGGMGTVYAAEQLEPVRRQVALKVVRAGLEQREVLQRFERERQALALMEHPNIARVLDAGATDRGQPWFAMELVHGEPITDYCDRQRLALDQRLELFVQVCSGVQHAHQKGVIHRDIKPGNVLVETVDERPVVRIIDFGLARATHHVLAQHSVFTEVGQVLGTPEYMSPEQAEMTNADIDTRTDVYSLGVLLYELITGSLPFPGAELRAQGLFEIRRQIREVDPPLPSRRLSTIALESRAAVARQRRTSAPALVRNLRQDLDWVTMRCLEKDRARRYQTPQELAADVQRHLRGEAVTAGRPSALYLLRKAVRRHRYLVGFAATVMAVAAVGFVLVLQGRAAEAAERRRAERANAELRGQLEAVARRLELDRVRELLAGAAPLQPVTVQNLEDAVGWVRRADATTRRVDDADAAATADQAQQLDASTHAELQRDLERLRALRQELDRRAAAVLAAQAAVPAQAWDAARRALAADPRTADVALPDLPGLCPLGADPESGLQEFAVLLTGAVPTRAADGALELPVDSAAVLVLLPGGDARVGAAAGDDLAQPVEQPQQRVRLAPFLIGKHELTQHQWLQMTGEEPSRWHVGTGPPEQMGPQNPVEQVTWAQATTALGVFGLCLPTEAQWEYAARGGAAARWWTGDDRRSLAGPPAENVADAASIRAGARFTGADEWPDYDDRAVVHVAVCSYRGNAFGLHDVLGNVKELCADPWVASPAAAALEPGTGLRRARESRLRAVRGGSFFNGVSEARVSARRSIDRDQPFDNVGVRIARLLPAR